MDPITLAILTGVGGQALSQAGKLIPTAAERTQKKDLKELQRLQEMNALGLTDKEQAAMVNKLSQSANMQQQQSMQDRARLMAGGGTATGGQSMQEAVALDAARAAQQERVGQVVLEADLAREQEQKDKMAALEAGASQLKADRIDAAASIAGAGIEAGLTSAADQKIMQGAKAPSPQMIASTKQTYGFQTDDEARGFIELNYTDPTAAKLMQEMMITKAKSRGAQ
tara:strand:+ start:2014 stop:2691 length:678 start_codon:yes stop_codon:yes gene_type:complete